MGGYKVSIRYTRGMNNWGSMEDKYVGAEFKEMRG